MKRAMEVMVWFYENFNNFFPLIHDEDDDGDGGGGGGGDGDDKAEDDDDENEDVEKLKEEGPRHREQRPFIEEELCSREDEQAALQIESPSFTKGRSALKREPSPLTEELRPSLPNLERFLFKAAVSSPKEERPNVRGEQFPFKVGRPILKQKRSPLKKELPNITGERSAPEIIPSAFEELSTLKGKQPILKKRRSPRRVLQPTFKEEHPTLEKDGPTRFEMFHRSLHFAEPKETISLEEPDVLLSEEILSAASQVGHLFFPFFPSPFNTTTSCITKGYRH